MGRAVMDFVPDGIVTFLHMMPSTCRVVGSEKGEGIVRLIVESDDIADDWQGQVTATVQDAGSTRVIRIVPTDS